MNSVPQNQISSPTQKWAFKNWGSDQFYFFHLEYWADPLLPPGWFHWRDQLSEKFPVDSQLGSAVFIDKWVKYIYIQINIIYPYLYIYIDIYIYIWMAYKPRMRIPIRFLFQGPNARIKRWSPSPGGDGGPNLTPMVPEVIAKSLEW